MDNNNSSGTRAGATEGKGFYIVLLLCAAVVGVSAWILLSGPRTNVETTEAAEKVIDVSDAIVTMVPSGSVRTSTVTEKPVQAEEPAEEVIEAEPAAETSAEAEDYETQAVFSETVTSYVWPLRGRIEAPYAMSSLIYDATMGDWRAHNGIDIAGAIGDEVIASAGGTVVSVKQDDLLGTVVEIDHANGVHSVYANLAQEPAVHEGDIVTMGQTIGSVSNTALGEINMVPHLHFSMTLDGLSADPMSYLPAEPAEE